MSNQEQEQNKEDESNILSLSALEEGNIHLILDDNEQRESLSLPDNTPSLKLTRSEPLPPKNVANNPMLEIPTLSRGSSNPEMSSSKKMSAHQLSSLSKFRSYLETAIPLPLLRRRRSSSITNSVPLFLCAICLENHAITDSFSLESCTAQHRFCTDSMTMYLSSLIKEGAVLSLKCPCFGMDGCDAVFSKEEVNKLVDDSCFEQYSRLLEIKTNPNARECPTCSQFSTSGSEENPEMKCEGCGTVFCYLHNNAHPEISCQEYVRRTAKTDLWSAATIKATSRTCPQCKAPTQKSSGCNHMTCQHCGADWCWLCGRAIDDDHYDGFSTCTGQQFSEAPNFVLWGVCPCLRWSLLFYVRTFLFFLYVFALATAAFVVAVASLSVSLINLPFSLLAMYLLDSDDWSNLLMPSIIFSTFVCGLVAISLNLAYLPIPIVVTFVKYLCNGCSIKSHNYIPHDGEDDEQQLYELWFYPIYIVAIYILPGNDD